MRIHHLSDALWDRLENGYFRKAGISIDQIKATAKECAKKASRLTNEQIDAGVYLSKLFVTIYDLPDELVALTPLDKVGTFYFLDSMTTDPEKRLSEDMIRDTFSNASEKSFEAPIDDNLLTAIADHAARNAGALVDAEMLCAFADNLDLVSLEEDISFDRIQIAMTGILIMMCGGYRKNIMTAEEVAAVGYLLDKAYEEELEEEE